jgi:hypothetical protein
MSPVAMKIAAFRRSLESSKVMVTVPSYFNANKFWHKQSVAASSDNAAHVMASKEHTMRRIRNWDVQFVPKFSIASSGLREHSSPLAIYIKISAILHTGLLRLLSRKNSV